LFSLSPLPAQPNAESPLLSTTDTSTATPQVTNSIPLQIKKEPREVRVKNVSTGKRFWLDYTHNKELIELEKAGFIALRTRRIRAPGQLRSWESILRDFIIIMGKEGLRTLILKGEQTQT
jgi:hypothetical protein